MLRLYLGRAGSGKTSTVLNELAGRAREGRGGNVLIVPEQYSHDCERALAALGDELCLYCEVLSFTRLAYRVFAETGGMAERTMDAGGRMLAMSMAYMSVSSHLKVYDVGVRRPDFLGTLIATYDELRAASAGCADLDRAAAGAGGALAGKLSDLSLIFTAYDALRERSGLDPRDTLDRLAAAIGKSSVGDTGGVWVDGFSDFTSQELRVLSELIKKGADVTVCLNAGDLTDRDPAFRLPIRTAGALMKMAREHRERVELRSFQPTPGRDPALRYLERTLTDYTLPPFRGDSSAIRVYRAGAVSEECHVAAYWALETVRRGGRFRDVAVVSPSWDTYAPILEGVFKKYGVPLTRTQKSDIMEKPVMAFLASALDIITSGWDYVNVFRCLKTGLSGLSLAERDTLENYVLRWSIRGESAWTREWTMPTGGVGEGDPEELAAINVLRARVSGPVAALSRKLASRPSALGKVRAVYEFMEDTGLYGILRQKARELKSAGRGELAQEYGQLWDIIVGALEQFAGILGETQIDTEEFVRLLKLVLGQYKVGVIPTSVDSVRAGDMTRLRARGIRHLIVLGAVDGALPVPSRNAGVFTDPEREELRALGIDTIDDREDELARELAGVYASLTVPTGSLTFTYPAGSRPSFVVTRVERLFGLAELTPGEEVYTAAPGPCFELAATGGGETERAARKYFEENDTWREYLAAIDRAASAPRGSLRRETAARLYGGKMRLSASRIEKYYSCRYAYFLQYGLRAKIRSEAALDAPALGSFMHYVLEHVAREAGERGGFDRLTPEDVREMVPKYVEEFARTKLGGVENRSGRFKYLYRRVRRAATEVALAMYEDLKSSDFKPLDFELRFAPDGDLPAVPLESGDSVVGAVDRVDGWVKNGKLYLRVIDYKTGQKKMELGDILSGIGLQMYIYLFALQRQAGPRYGGMEVVPAGVLYSPARDELVKSKTDLDEAALEKKRASLIKYSGLVLADPEVLEAMEHGTKKRLPVRVMSKTGELCGGIASAEQLGRLSRLVDRLLLDMAKEVRAGSINANPCIRGQVDSACEFCKFYDACHFEDGRSGESFRRLTKLKIPEFWEKVEEADK